MFLSILIIEQKVNDSMKKVYFSDIFYFYIFFKEYGNFIGGNAVYIVFWMTERDPRYWIFKHTSSKLIN